MGFESSLRDPRVPMAMDFRPERNTLLVMFSGLASQYGLQFFEFNTMTRALHGVNKIYLRDHRRSWYHRGLDGIGPDIDGIVEFLRPYTHHPSTQRTVMIGNSGGGYAALLFGYLLQANEVHAFSPKTFLDPYMRWAVRDIPRRWPARFSVLRLLLAGQPKYFDLMKVMEPSLRRDARFYVHYAANHRMDSFHAVRLGQVDGVILRPYAYDEHDLIVELKRQGVLAEIVERAASSFAQNDTGRG